MDDHKENLAVQDREVALFGAVLADADLDAELEALEQLEADEAMQEMGDLAPQ